MYLLLSITDFFLNLLQLCIELYTRVVVQQFSASTEPKSLQFLMLHGEKVRELAKKKKKPGQRDFLQGIEHLSCCQLKGISIIPPVPPKKGYRKGLLCSYCQIALTQNMLVVFMNIMMERVLDKENYLMAITKASYYMSQVCVAEWAAQWYTGGMGGIR